jgi:hypothetical protein
MMSGEKMIEINKSQTRDELTITTLKIFDDRNDIIARIDAEDGLWVQNSTRKKRPDKSTLVVYDHSDTEVLRVQFLNRSAILLTGIFRHNGIAEPTIITSEYMKLGRGPVLSRNAMGDGGPAAINVR